MKPRLFARPWLFVRLRRDRRAATALEFALIAVPFLALGLGSIEFGRLIWTREALQASAISGARCMGILESSCASAGAYSATGSTSYITSVANGWGITLPSSDLTLNAAATCAGVAGFSQVSISYTFQTILPRLITALAHGVSLSASACFPNQA
jgi:Flp pilus assembly protein TadG